MVLSYQSLKKLITGVQPMIHSDLDLLDFLQMASLDLPIADRVYRMSVSTVPKNGECVKTLIDRFKMYEFEIKPEGALLEHEMVYIIPLKISLSLSKEFYASFSSKSTSGRNDQSASHLSNANPEMNITVLGYEGELYLEVMPMSWHTTIYPHTALSQMRIHTADSKPLSNTELSLLHAEYGIVRDSNGNPTDPIIANDSLRLHLDLSVDRVGHESVRNPDNSVHLGKKELDEYDDFFRPIKKTSQGDIILHPDGFYLLATKERVFIPPNVCAVMEQYSTTLGEFSSHEAGFFDNNFGDGGGTQAVLEVHINKRKSVRFWDGRPICRMVFYRTDEVPEILYGRERGSHYVGSGPSLPKNIKNYSKW